MNKPMSIKKINFFNPEQFVEIHGSKRAASKLIGIKDANWNRDSQDKLVANIGEYYWFVEDRSEFYG